MNRWFVLLGGLVVVAALSFAACGDDDSSQSRGGPPGNGTPLHTPTLGAGALPTGTANPADVRPLEDVLTEAINEEYKARATYQSVIESLGSVVPFSNIVVSENAHVEAWKALFVSNNLSVPADTYAGNVTAPATLTTACQAGVAAETEDVALYDRLMTQTSDPAALIVMAQQRQVSQENHLPAFQRCA